MRYLGRVYVSDFVLDQTAGIGRVKRFSPSHGVLTGLSPVNRNISYSQPPKQQPKNGATIGTLTEIRQMADGHEPWLDLPRNSSLRQTKLHGHIQSYRTPNEDQNLVPS
jgi:hypothetical protein